MKTMRSIFGQLAMATAGGLWALAALGQESPDTVFLNGKILTVDEEFSVVQALEVTGNRIAATGANEGVEALVGEGTRVVDLGGRTAIPGLIDNHNHLIFNAPTWPNGVRLGRVRTRAEARHGWQVAEHLNWDITPNRMLEIFEEVNEIYPITHLRWRFEHAQGLSQPTIERAKALGMTIPADEIRDLNSVLTMVDGRIVCEVL